MIEKDYIYIEDVDGFLWVVVVNDDVYIHV